MPIILSPSKLQAPAHKEIASSHILAAVKAHKQKKTELEPGFLT